MPKGVKKKYIELKIGSARHLPAMDPNGELDPFVRVKLDGKDIAKTSIVKKNRFPVWNESFKFDLDGPFYTFVLDVGDEDISKKRSHWTSYSASGRAGNSKGEENNRMAAHIVR
jgi:Ca2+-dependent lipid-binding protein